MTNEEATMAGVAATVRARADGAAIERLIEEAWNRGNLEVVAELYDPDYIGHDPFSPGPLAGPESVRDRIAAFRSAFPDLALSVEDVIIEGDRLAYRYVARGTHDGDLGTIAASGRGVTVVGLEIVRFARARIAEEWGCWDALGLLRQLGVISEEVSS
jgi:steroid delta-isomerase-like uncharacterized protein